MVYTKIEHYGVVSRLMSCLISAMSFFVGLLGFAFLPLFLFWFMCPYLLWKAVVGGRHAHCPQCGRDMDIHHNAGGLVCRGCKKPSMVINDNLVLIR